MGPLRKIGANLAKYFLLEVLAVAGMVAYVFLSIYLPYPGPELLSAFFLVCLVLALLRRLVRALKDPAGAIRRHK